MRSFARWLIPLLVLSVLVGCVPPSPPPTSGANTPRSTESPVSMLPHPRWDPLCDDPEQPTVSQYVNRGTVRSLTINTTGPSNEESKESTSEEIFYVENQLVVIGTQGAINEVVPAAAELLATTLSLNATTAFSSSIEDAPVIQLYSFDENQDPKEDLNILEVVATIREVSAQTGLLVFADPNYVISRPNRSAVGSAGVPPAGGDTPQRTLPLPEEPRLPLIEAYPLRQLLGAQLPNVNWTQVDAILGAIQQSAAGSTVALSTIGDAQPPTPSAIVVADPLSGEASPLSGEASPINFPSDVPASAAFWSQWALGNPVNGGIGLAVDGARLEQIPDGMDTRIVILDTSPFTQTGMYWFEGGGWHTPTLTLCVDHPVTVALFEPAQEGVPQEKKSNVDDHGLFVAGLAHAVAPRSKIQLIRVLNEDGKGDLAGILHVLAQLSEELPPPIEENEDKWVINMSLGFTATLPPSCEGTSDDCLQQLNDAIETLGCNPGDTYADLSSCFARMEGEPDELYRARLEILEQLEVPTLQEVLRRLLASNKVVIAAAAGNNPSDAELTAQYPARFAEMDERFSAMLAVAASTNEKTRAFYSQKGTIAAPGGGDNNPSCSFSDPKEEGCWESEHYLISIGTLEDQERQQFDYTAWAGSSFATPLIAGAAAVLFAGRDASATVAEVKKYICEVPDGMLGAGILHIPSKECTPQAVFP